MKRFLSDKGEAIFPQKQAAGKAAAVAAKNLVCIGRRKADLALPGFQAAQTGKSQTGPFGICPVSYTHLDVYKRQHRRRQSQSLER